VNIPRFQKNLKKKEKKSILSKKKQKKDKKIKNWCYSEYPTRFRVFYNNYSVPFFFVYFHQKLSSNSYPYHGSYGG
jgi:hypothetical protein